MERFNFLLVMDRLITYLKLRFFQFHTDEREMKRHPINQYAHTRHALMKVNPDATQDA